MTAMDQAEPVRPGPGPAEQGIHRDLGLIGVPAVEVHGDDSALHGRLLLSPAGGGECSSPIVTWAELCYNAKTEEAWKMAVYTEKKTYHTKAHMGMIDVTDDFRAACRTLAARPA